MNSGVTMSSVPSSVKSEMPYPTGVINLPPAVRQLLAVVRSRIRRDAMVSGLLFLICCAAILFWITLGLDASWFALQRLELPVGLRAIMLAGILPGMLWLLASRVALPLVRRVRDSDVAILLERKFPQFQDRLITAVESAGGYPVDGPLVTGMLQRSIAEADSLATGIVVEDIFDVRQLKQRGLAAGVLAVSIAAVAILQPGSLQRWWSAFVRCEEVYHERTTDLEIRVVAQPGDRRVDFRHEPDRRLYLHPRGADLELELTVPVRRAIAVPGNDAPADSDPALRPGAGENEWIVPERIRVDVSRSDGTRSRSYVSATSDRTFRFVITRLQEPVRLEFLAGDFRSVVPYDVEPVNAPGLDSIELRCQYPDYTGWNELREQNVTVTGSEISLPLGTRFLLTATAAKPLQSARLVCDWFELSGDRESHRVIAREGVRVEALPSGPLISADGLTVAAAFALVSVSEPGADGKQSVETSTATAAESSTARDGTSRQATELPSTPGALPIASNTAIRFFLHDDDGVMSVNPETLRVRGIDDRPPVVTTRGVGIDSAITRMARIPIAGRITDDYGLVASGFQFLVDDETNWRPRPFRVPSPVRVTEFDLQRTDSEPYEIFEVLPLELTEGQTLTLAVASSDGNTLTGPGFTRGEPIVFRIVSNEELLSLLYTREITLRRRFEEVINQLVQVRDDLNFHREPARRLDLGEASGMRPEDKIGVTTCATRSGNSLRRQANELNSIAEGFDEIVRQLINNAIPPQTLADNMRDQILLPILDITAQPMTDADRVLSEFRVAALAGDKTETLIKTSAEHVGRLLVRLNVILERVRDMAEFHEALRDLKAILEEQQRLLEETRSLQKRNLIDRLKLLK